MRIVSFGDIHMALRSIERLAPELRRADLVILSGDLTNFGGREEAARVIDAAQRHIRTVLALSGNLDRLEVIEFLCQRGVSLHGKSRRVGSIGIFGCGGSNVTPFHTPTELTEDELTAVLARGYSDVADAPHRLMVCHTPPANTTTDRLRNGQHVGSAAVRAFIQRHQPEVCITGHIHESAGIDHIGRTTIGNAGALRDGGYLVITGGTGGLTMELKYLT